MVKDGEVVVIVVKRYFVIKVTVNGQTTNCNRCMQLCMVIGGHSTVCMCIYDNLIVIKTGYWNKLEMDTVPYNGPQMLVLMTAVGSYKRVALGV